MHVEVRTRGLEAASDVREHAVRRIHATLSRFAGEVSSALVRITDVNGPRGGADKRCQITLRGQRIGSATVEEHHADAYAAIHLAVERAAAAVGRTIERRRSQRRDWDRMTWRTTE